MKPNRNYYIKGADRMRIRPAMAQDQPNVVALDGRITSIPKPDYWASMFDQFVGQDGQHFLIAETRGCLLYTSPSPRDKRQSRMPSSA